MDTNVQYVIRPIQVHKQCARTMSSLFTYHSVKLISTLTIYEYFFSKMNNFFLIDKILILISSMTYYDIVILYYK
jgi:hypothetical protein